MPPIVQIPFHVFFGATVLGKAFVKIHLQMLGLVFLMSRPVFEGLLRNIKQAPAIGMPSRSCSSPPPQPSQLLAAAGTWLHDTIRDLQASTQARFVGDSEQGASKGGVRPRIWSPVSVVSVLCLQSLQSLHFVS